MPNYRALSCMPADGGDLVLALTQDEFMREFDRHCAMYPQRDPKLTAFERGDHAPAHMREKPAAKTAQVWVQHDGCMGCPPALSFDAKVLVRFRDGAQSMHPLPAGCVDWAHDGSPEDVVAYFVKPAASETAKRSGWVMHDQNWRRSEAPCAGIKWMKQRNGRIRAASEWGDYHNRLSLWDTRSSREHEFDFIAYSTDTECPPWPAEA